METYNESLKEVEIALLSSLIGKTAEIIKHQEPFVPGKSMEFISLKIDGQWYRLSAESGDCDFNDMDDLAFLKFAKCEEKATEYPPQCKTNNIVIPMKEKITDIILVEDMIERRHKGNADSVLNHTKAVVFVLESKQYAFELDDQYWELIKVSKGQKCLENVEPSTIYWGNGEEEDGYSWHCSRQIISLASKTV